MAGFTSIQRNPERYRLTYAGVPFVLDAGVKVRLEPTGAVHQAPVDLYEEIDRRLPWRWLQDFLPPAEYPGRALEGVAQRRPADAAPAPAVRPGEWFYPNGARRWSVFRGLATSLMVREMLAFTEGRNAAEFVMKAVPEDSPSEDAYEVRTDLYMLPPRPLSELGGGMDGLYLVTLVDERYYWQFHPVSLDFAPGTTWLTLVNRLAAALGVGITLDPVPAAFGGPEADSPLWCHMESAAVLLDALALNVGATVVRAFDGSYSLMTPDVSADIIDANRGDNSLVTRFGGGELFASGDLLPAGETLLARNAVLPASVKVSFPRWVVGNDPVPHRVNARSRAGWHEDGPGAVWTETVTLASGGLAFSGVSGVSGLALGVHSAAKAFYSGLADAEPANRSGLRALAVRLAQDRWEELAYATTLDESYQGCYAWEPEGIHDVLWTYSAKMRQGSTRVMHSPWNQAVREYQHALKDPGTQSFSPPGIGGHSVSQAVRDSVHPPATASVSTSGAPATSLYPITTALAAPLASAGVYAQLASIDRLPTGNRWKALVGSEVILFEGTSGGLVGTGAALATSGALLSGSQGSGYLSGSVPEGTVLSGGVVSGFSAALNVVAAVLRGVDGTSPALHAAGDELAWKTPNAAYDVNLTTYGEGQFVFPHEYTSGGVRGVRVLPQTQTVRVFSDEALAFNGVDHYSGAVHRYDASQNSGSQFIESSLIWVVERNGAELKSGRYYDGQLVDFSVAASGFSGAYPSAPVYAASVGGAAAINMLEVNPLSGSEAAAVISGVHTLEVDRITDVLRLFDRGNGVARLSAFTSGGRTIEIDQDINIYNSGYVYTRNEASISRRTIYLSGGSTCFESPVSICNFLFWCYYTEEPWTGDVEVWEVPDLPRKIAYRVSVEPGRASVNLDGIRPSTNPCAGGLRTSGTGDVNDGPQVLALVNVTPVNNSLSTNPAGNGEDGAIILRHGAVGPGPFRLPGSVDLPLRRDEAVVLWHDPEDGCWRLLAHSNAGLTLRKGAATPVVDYVREIRVGSGLVLANSGGGVVWIYLSGVGGGGFTGTKHVLVSGACSGGGFALQRETWTIANGLVTNIT